MQIKYLGGHTAPESMLTDAVISIIIKVEERYFLMTVEKHDLVFIYYASDRL